MGEMLEVEYQANDSEIEIGALCITFVMYKNPKLFLQTLIQIKIKSSILRYLSLLVLCHNPHKSSSPRCILIL